MGRGRRGFAAVLGRVERAVNGAVALVVVPGMRGWARPGSLTLIDIIAVRQAVDCGSAGSTDEPDEPAVEAVF